MSHIFICYSYIDKHYTNNLTTVLQKHGFEVWIDRQINYGDQWFKLFQEKIDACSVFIIIMSSNSYNSKWVENEVKYAIEMNKPIVALRLAGDLWAEIEVFSYFDVKDDKLPPTEFYEELANFAQRSI